MKEQKEAIRKDIENIRIEAGKRTYFVTAVEGMDKARYIKITQRTLKENGESEYDKILIYKDSMEGMFIALSKIVRHFKINKHLQQYLAKLALAEFKNTNNPWDAKEDLKLEKLYCERKTIDELATIFERDYDAIEARIKQLGLQEKYDFNVD